VFDVVHRRTRRSGRTITLDVVLHRGAVAVVPLLNGSARDPEILFVRQYRHPVGETTWEIPAGKLSSGEKPLSCVRRELEEETGFRARRVKRMLSYWPTSAFANEVIHIFRAEDLHPGKFNPDADEIIEPVRLPLSRALRMIKSGRIKDSKTIIALLFFASWR
jgi:ADP-ribose pyrophosphatase